MKPFLIYAISLFATSSLASPHQKRQDGSQALSSLSVGPNSASAGPNSLVRPSPTGSGALPTETGGFCNVVFNTGAPSNSGWPSVTWKSLTSYGVSGFIAFTINRIRDTPIYNVNGVPARFDDAMDATQLPICMDPRDIPTLKHRLQNSTLPYVELFNEPDYSYGGYTPLTSAQNASNYLRPILNTTYPTKFISPVPAGTGGPYLTDFNSSCPECMKRLDYIGAHVYSVEAQGAIDMVTALHDKWKKDIWITELSPASGAGQGCEYDMAGMINWMNTTVSGLRKLDYVKKIFWNQGEWSHGFSGDDSICNPSLTNEDGSPTKLLETYGDLCGDSVYKVEIS